MSSARSTNTVTHSTAYKTLTDFFICHEDSVVTIEILPPQFRSSNGTILVEDHDIGIPKDTLVSAFVEAQKQFFCKNNSSLLPNEACIATKILLLFDPEHITAANFRKRRLLILKNGLLEDRAFYQLALKQELCFLNSILTSPLHRQTKSPSLWYHRFWVIKLFLGSEQVCLSREQRAAFWQSEINAVCKSSEQHSKNYHAWQYARRIMAHVEDQGVNDDIACLVKDWCFKHPSDTSGWSFLIFQLPKVRPVLRQAIVQEVLGYTINLQIEQEPVWVFIRAVVSYGKFCGDRVNTCHLLRDYNETKKTNGQYSVLSERIFQTFRWAEAFGEPLSAEETKH